MDLPEKFSYSKDHEWISTTKGQAKIGVTSYAIEQLGDIVHLDLPDVGAIFAAGQSFGTIESTKTVSDLYMPVDAKIVEVNTAVKSNPESLQSDAYHAGWLVKVEILKEPRVNDLMDAKAYEEFLKG